MANEVFSEYGPEIRITDMSEGEGDGSRFGYGKFINLGVIIHSAQLGRQFYMDVRYDQQEPGDVPRIEVYEKVDRELKPLTTIMLEDED